MIRRFVLLSGAAPLPSAHGIRKIVRTVFRRENARLKGELNVIFVDNDRIRKLNRKFFRKNSLTDVIAFPFHTPPAGTVNPAFGDIFISVPTAKANAARFQEPLRKELIRLIVHGTLHLLGYDDHKKSQRARMWRRQEEIVGSL